MLQRGKLVLGWPRQLPGDQRRKGHRGGRRLLRADEARSERGSSPQLPRGPTSMLTVPGKQEDQRQRELDPAALNTVSGAFINKKAIYFTV